MTRCTSPFLPPWAFALALAASVLVCPPANAQGGAVYRCPGKTGGADEFTNLISEVQARERNCRTIENAPITIVQTVKPKPAAVGLATPSGGGSTRSGDSRVDPAAQRQRDSDARRVLDDELRREEDRLAQQKREFNNGEPERRGDERNFQNYLDRVAQMKAGIARTESDIAALKREIGKLPP